MVEDALPMTTLDDPIRYGAIAAPNRFVMAPLTRGRSTREHVPTPLMVDYYQQRASAGLIITEATGISREGLGWPYAPGVWTDAQGDGWKKVTDAVHRAGGRIVLQLWHMGRIVHPSFLGGDRSVSASATTAPHFAHTYDGKQPHAESRALGLEEVPRLLEDYRIAARQAVRAGFDGVQLHAANGYLIDQFLRESSNRRTDGYGGPIANRIRLLDEVTRAVAEVVGEDRVGVRLSPNGETQGVNDSNPNELFTAAATRLQEIGIAFLELREQNADGTFGKSDVPKVSPLSRQAFAGPLILNSEYDAAKANAAIESGAADAISFGRPFLANPDLPRRFREHLPLNEGNIKTWYSQGPEGYTDYPFAT